MKDGYKVIDMDTHVNPSMEVLESTSTQVSGCDSRS